MYISFIELVNFRKLKATRIEFAEGQTLFVGSNNSGKTSAMTALRLFLKDRSGMTARDVTLSNWRAINQLGEEWLTLKPNQAPDANALIDLLPAMDIWLEVEDEEIHHVASLLPSLEWSGGKIGVRLQLEPKDIEALVSEYKEATTKANELINDYQEKSGDKLDDFALWPKSFHDFFERRFGALVGLKAYALDPDAIADLPPDNTVAPQVLSETATPLDGDPLAQLIHFREIRAQRGALSEEAVLSRRGRFRSVCR